MMIILKMGFLGRDDFQVEQITKKLKKINNLKTGTKKRNRRAE